MRPVTAWSLSLTLLLAAQARAQDGGAPALHLMAFNLLYQGADDAKSLKAIADEAPDVVCLRELSSTFAKSFEAAQSKDFPYRNLAPKASGTWGVGLASKRPLKNVQTYAIGPVGIPAMEATVEHDGREVRLVCVHLIPPKGKGRDGESLSDELERHAATRAKQADALVARFKGVTTPVVLFGDFNEEPVGKALKTLEAAGWVRGCAVADKGCSATFPGPALPWPAVFTIDHVLARGLAFDSAKTLRAGGSDHYPVSAVLRAEPKVAPARK